MTIGIESAVEPAPAQRARTTRARSIVGAAVLAATATVQIVLLVIRPWGQRNHLSYDDVEPIRDRLWTGSLVSGLTFCILAVALAHIVCSVVRSRGSMLATAGALVVTIGGALSAMGSLALATFVWYATGPAISTDAGRALMSDAIGVGGHPKASLATWPIMVGYLAFSLGSLLLFAALVRSRSVPRRLPVALIIATIAMFVVPPGQAQDFVQVGFMALVAILAVVVYLAGRVAGDQSYQMGPSQRQRLSR